MRARAREGVMAGAALLGMAVVAKVAVLALRLVDGSWQPEASPWLPLLLFHEDVFVAAALALVALVLPPPLRWTLHAALTLYVAANVPIARFFGTPLTWGLLVATGGALSDSIAREVTVGNVVACAAVLAAGATAPFVVRRLEERCPRLLRGTLGLALVAACLGPLARARHDSLGVHRNAVWTLARTAMAHGQGASEVAPAIAWTPTGAAVDLTGLRGAARGRNVLWVVLESTAAQYLRPYGAPDDPTPYLSRLAAESLVFDAAYAAYPESIKGLWAQLCAASPARATPVARYAAGQAPCDPVVERFRVSGHRTGLFHSGHFAYLGMAGVIAERGFEVLEDAVAAQGAAEVSSFGVDERWTVGRVLAFVDAAGERPFFAMYLPIAGHHPYRAPGEGRGPFPGDEGFGAYRNDLWKGDRALGVLLDGLRARGRLDDTLVVVVGDHGEAFGQHPGNVAHTLQIYEENMRVPLVVRLPGGRQRGRVPQVTGAIDLGPTVLDLAGLSPVAGEGRSVLEPIPGAARFFADHGSTLVGMREDRWKVIVDVESDRTKLFDVRADPGETRDLSAGWPELTRRYRDHLVGWAEARRGVVLGARVTALMPGGAP